MTELRKIYKKDIPNLLSDAAFWKHEFLAVSKHRLYAHYKNPTSSDDDIVLILAYLNQELVGYMGVFIDQIILDDVVQKIGWLSTWWVHPKTKGTGIGRQILDEMYQINQGKIGISQFTPSAKRVYDKSGYFTDLKQNIGMKAVLRSNLVFVIPTLKPWAKKALPLLRLTDSIINGFLNAKLSLQKNNIKKNLKGISVDYLNIIDQEVQDLIYKYNKNHISKKENAFFEWLKAYHWVQESPLLSMTNKEKYEFSIYDRSFNVYLIKILERGVCVGFVVLQKRNHVSKLLFAYYDTTQHAKLVANVIKLQLMEQNTRELICYDEAICAELKKSSVFIYTTKKVKNSIISKAFGKTDFTDVIMNFGDGDCCFA
jgi:GNAT superfamily N-acetyltransferase